MASAYCAYGLMGCISFFLLGRTVSLVALRPSEDLLFCAKYLFGAAKAHRGPHPIGETIGPLRPVGGPITHSPSGAGAASPQAAGARAT